MSRGYADRAAYPAMGIVGKRAAKPPDQNRVATAP